jgi:hypothetical protein
MTPFYFTEGPRRLYAAYTAAAHSGGARRVAVFCNPFGQEAIRSHRIYRVLADRLSREGIATLRFDYSSTGDSAGDCEEASIRDWVADVRAAEREALRRSGAAEVAHVGVRLGASLSLLASTEPAAVPRRLVLWDPVVHGRAYLEDLARAHLGFLSVTFRCTPERVARVRGIRSPETMQELVGFAVTDSLRREITAIDLLSSAGLAASHVTVLADERTAEARQLLDRMTRQGIAAEQIALEADAPWNSEEALNASTIPARTLDHIAASVRRH